MKKFSKILAVLFAIVLACGIFALCVSAADNSEPQQASEDITDFQVQINLTLYDYFVFNVYIPKEVADAATEIRIDGAVVDKSEWAPAKINGEKYYAIKKEFNVVNAYDSFSFTVNFPEGKTKTLVLSIPEYAEIIDRGNYTQPAKDLVASALTYIKASCEYFEPNNYDFTEELTTVKNYAYEATKSPAASDAIKEIMNSFAVVLDQGRLVFRFNLQDNVSDAGKVLTFKYFENKEVKSVTTAAADWVNGHYDITLRAKDMQSDISVILGALDTVPVDYTFSLANYYYSIIYGGMELENRAALLTLINALFDYSEKAADYSPTKDSNPIADTDTVIVRYSDYGAQGDGVTNDFAAIKSAHDYANELRAQGKKVIVKADRDKTYYIGSTVISDVVYTIDIKTNVDWGNANFIIDDDIMDYNGVYTPSGSDKGYDLHDKHIFNVVSDYEMVKITDETLLNEIVKAGLGPDTEKIDLGLGYPAMIIPFNSEHNIYKRKGYGGHTGYPMREVIVLDKNGRVDAETALAFTYTNVDYIEVYRLDIEPLTIEGGIFTTKAPSVNIVNNNAPVDKYFLRGISVNRSYTTLKNIQHYVTNEVSLERQATGEIGAKYNGFYYVNQTDGVTLDGCVLTGRRCYNEVYFNRQNSTDGTYDMQVFYSNKTVFKDCTQSNFWVDDNANAVPEGTEGAKLSMDNSTKLPMVQVGASKVMPQMHWGVGGSNDCKNLEYHGSTLSRFDAHRGLYGGKIIDSSVNCIALSGGGELVIENSRVFCENENNNYLVHLRSDYGSNWNGTVDITNVKMFPHPEKITPSNLGREIYWPIYIFYHNYTNWDFGYECHFPSTTIDGLEFYDRLTQEKMVDNDVMIYILTESKSTSKENNMHLPTVVGGTDENYNPAPWYSDFDKNGDELVDGTNIKFDGSTDRNGVQDTSSNVNVNPIVPPEYIRIYNNTDYTYNFPDTSVTSFFANTEIVDTSEAAPLPPPIIVDREDDAPTVGYQQMIKN